MALWKTPEHVSSVVLLETCSGSTIIFSEHFWPERQARRAGALPRDSLQGPIPPRADSEMRLGQSTQKCDSVSLLANTTRRGDSQRRLGESARTQLPRSHADPSPDSQVFSSRPPRDGRRSLAARAADRSARQARGTQPNCKRAASWDRQASDFGFLLLDCRFSDKRTSPRRAARPSRIPHLCRDRTSFGPRPCSGG